MRLLLLYLAILLASLIGTSLGIAGLSTTLLGRAIDDGEGRRTDRSGGGVCISKQLLLDVPAEVVGLFDRIEAHVFNDGFVVELEIGQL